MTMKTATLFRWVTLFALVGLGRMSAALEWTDKEISVEVQRDLQKEVRAKFEFRNTGPKTVTILGVTTSCGCTVANPESSTVASGDKSNVQALFTIADRHGRQEKIITVETDDPENPKIVLMLRINLLEPTQSPPNSTKPRA